MKILKRFFDGLLSGALIAGLLGIGVNIFFGQTAGWTVAIIAVIFSIINYSEEDGSRQSKLRNTGMNVKNEIDVLTKEGHSCDDCNREFCPYDRLSPKPSNVSVCHRWRERG